MLAAPRATNIRRKGKEELAGLCGPCDRLVLAVTRRLGPPQPVSRTDAAALWNAPPVGNSLS